VCRVHLKSGSCGACLTKNITCDVKVSEAEWLRMRNERKRLREQIKDTVHAQEQTRKELDLMRERQLAEFAREMRLRRQLDLLEEQEDEAVAAEYNAVGRIGVQEEEFLQTPAETPSVASSGIQLGPSTWNAMDGGFDMAFEFWSANLESAGTGAEASGSS
jgi:Na+-translocating ferredoxin:NAD+ oxidoreductase RnfC subunit